MSADVNSEIFSGSGWLDLSSSGRGSAKTEDLLPDELARLTGNAALGGYGWFSGTLYNGGTWTVNEVVVRVMAKERDGSVRWSRVFRGNVSVPPLSTGKINIEVGADQGLGSSTWEILSAKGYRPE